MVKVFTHAVNETDTTESNVQISRERLIAAVEERPVLWDKYDRNSTHLINCAWKEVFSELHGKFETLEVQEKERFGELIHL